MDADSVRIASGEAYAVTLLSDNANDTAVEVTATLKAVEALQPTTRGRTIDVDASGEVAANNVSDLASQASVDALQSTDFAAAVVYRDPANLTPLRFYFPSTGVAAALNTESTLAISGGASAGITGTITEIDTGLPGFWYELAYNAADRPVGEGYASYVFTDGTNEQTVLLVVERLNAAKIGGSQVAADNLAVSAGTMQIGTVEDANTTPTTTLFAASDITEATAEHFRGRSLIFTSGGLLRQATRIESYALVSGEGRFTVVALTEAPADGDTFIIV